MDPMDLRQSDRSAEVDAPWPTALRAITWLAPGIPLAFFEVLCSALSRNLSMPIHLESRDRSSGPMHGDSDPFLEGQADIGFLCSPSYLYLASKPLPSVKLVPAAFAFDLGREDAEPIYYSEVIVRRQHRATSFDDLAGGVWGFNDECSLSGYFSALQQLEESGNDADFFGRHVRTGSHFASIRAVVNGDIDAAAIDSTVLSLHLRSHPDLSGQLRTLTSFGPFPIQPIVLRTGLAPSLATQIAQALLHVHEEEPGFRALARFGLLRLVSITEQAYAEERRALCSLSFPTLRTSSWPHSPSPRSISGGCCPTSAASAPRR